MYPIYRSRCMSTCADIGMLLGSSHSILCGTIGHIWRPEWWNVGFYCTLARQKLVFQPKNQRWEWHPLSPPLADADTQRLLRVRSSSGYHIKAEILLYIFHPGSAVVRQLEEKLCLDLLATSFITIILCILSLLYYIRLNTPSNAMAAW